MQYFISVSRHYECTKERCKLVIRETTFPGVLVEMIKEFKGCTIQSEEQVNTTIDYDEHVDERNWLRNNSAEQVDAISDS